MDIFRPDMLAGWIGYGCYFSTNLVFQWRFPLAVATLWPLLMLVVIPFIPESPRWREYTIEPMSLISLTYNAASASP